MIDDRFEKLDRKYERKYELTDETIKHEGRTLHRIRALRDVRPGVRKGDLGGWIEDQSNLAHVGPAWVYGDAMVYDAARLTGDAEASDTARVYGCVWLPSGHVTGDILKWDPGIPVPVVPDLDAAILAAIDAGGALDMREWHTCETTHCRAGWAITLGGEQGAALEKLCGAWLAGALIYQRSAGYVPDFLASDDDALADMRSRAGGA